MEQGRIVEFGHPLANASEGREGQCHRGDLGSREDGNGGCGWAEVAEHDGSQSGWDLEVSVKNLLHHTITVLLTFVLRHDGSVVDDRPEILRNTAPAPAETKISKRRQDSQ